MPIGAVVSDRIDAVITSCRSVAGENSTRSNAIANYLRLGTISAGQYRQIADMAVNIAGQIDAYPDRSIGDLCGFTLQGQNTFPVASNIPYLALVFMVRALEKTDCHVHISDNLTKEEVFEHFGYTLEKPVGDDDYIRNAEDLSYVARETCFRFLLDGVTNFNLRFNPAKLLGANDDTDPVLRMERNVGAVTNGANAAIEMYRKLPGFAIDPKIGLLFSFNRTRFDRYYDDEEEAVPIAVPMAAIDIRRNSDFPLRGIDVSGKERGLVKSDMHEVSDTWGPVFEAYRKGDLRIASHLGDFRNARHYFEDQEITDLGKMLEGYLNFVEAYLKIMKPGDGLGHAYIFNPEFLISPLWDKKYYTPLSLSDSQYGKYAARIEAMIETYDVKRFVIEHCPSASVRDFQTVQAYSALPLNYWIKCGFNVRIGSDAGIFSYNGPRNLSEDVARVMLSTKYSARQILSLVGVNI